MPARRWIIAESIARIQTSPAEDFQLDWRNGDRDLVLVGGGHHVR